MAAHWRHRGMVFVALVWAATTGGLVHVGAQAPTAGQPSKVEAIVEQIAREVAADQRAFQVVPGQAPEASSPAAHSNGVVHVDDDGRLEVLIHSPAAVGPAEEADVEAAGGTGFTRLVPAPSLPPGGLLQAWVPADRIADVAALAWVASVTAPGYGTPDVTTQGKALHGADVAQSVGYLGAGVKVGVISDGVSHLATSQSAGELGAVTVLDAGSGDEGTAMLEIVHDMAPSATLLFHAAGNGVVGLVNAMNNLVSAGANVIVHDIPVDTEPAFQKGIVATVSDNIAAAGVSLHASAGNLGNTHAARVPAAGTGTRPDGTANAFAGCAKTPDNVVAIAPGGDTTFDLVAFGGGFTAVLQWSEPRNTFPTLGQGSFTDVNLYLMNSSLTQCFASSVGVQANGVGSSIEAISGSASPGLPLKLVVDVEGTSSAVAPPLVDLRWRGASAVNTPTRAGSLNPNANFTGLASSSAAINAANGATAASGPIEPFSAGGPVQLVTTTRCPGGAAGPCAGVPGSSQTLAGPTWTAADRVSVSGAGGFPTTFAGTSAAAPHAAGCDAILRGASGNPAAPVLQIRTRLQLTALDRGPAGQDTVWGAGVLRCVGRTFT